MTLITINHYWIHFKTWVCWCLILKNELRVTYEGASLLQGAGWLTKVNEDQFPPSRRMPKKMIGKKEHSEKFIGTCRKENRNCWSIHPKHLWSKTGFILHLYQAYALIAQAPVGDNRLKSLKTRYDQYKSKLKTNKSSQEINEDEKSGEKTLKTFHSKRISEHKEPQTTNHKYLPPL